MLSFNYYAKQYHNFPLMWSLLNLIWIIYRENPLIDNETYIKDPFKNLNPIYTHLIDNLKLFFSCNTHSTLFTTTTITIRRTRYRPTWGKASSKSIDILRNSCILAIDNKYIKLTQLTTGPIVALLHGQKFVPCVLLSVRQAKSCA